jgi:hypothetical protein
VLLPAGLVDWYGACPRLRAIANLVVVGGIIDPAATSDAEEREQCQLMHDIMERCVGGGGGAGNSREQGAVWLKLSRSAKRTAQLLPDYDHA